MQETREYWQSNTNTVSIKSIEEGGKKMQNTYHDSISKPLNTNTGNRSSGELKNTQMSGKHLGNKAKHVIENGDDDGRAREEPEEP